MTGHGVLTPTGKSSRIFVRFPHFCYQPIFSVIFFIVCISIGIFTRQKVGFIYIFIVVGCIPREGGPDIVVGDGGLHF